MVERVGEDRCVKLQREAMQFGHADCKTRYEKIMFLLGCQDASASFPFLFKDQHRLKGLYRFINNKAVTHDSFLTAYQSGLIQYATEQPSQAEDKPWLLI